MKLLYVEWVDASGPQEEWTPMKKIASLGPAHNKSVGFVIREDKNVVVLVPHTCEDGDGFGDITIPIGSITKRRVIRL